MAFLKFAKATLIHPHITGENWSNIRKAAKAQAEVNENLIARAAEIFEKPFDPADYLFSHASIVASVDTEDVPQAKLGSVFEGGRRINRKFSNYWITPQTAKYINNNNDSFSRPVLKKSYRSFIGGHSFVEHVQVPDLSKGRIIDAVLREVCGGESTYADILIANERKHKDLIASVLAGDLSTLSMGCFLAGTRVSLADGTRVPIEFIQPGDMVLTHKGRSKPVSNLQIRKGEWRLRHIQAVGVNEVISATDTHPFFVYRPPSVCRCGCEEPLPQREGYRNELMSRYFKRGHQLRVLNPSKVYSLEEYRLLKDRLDELQKPVLEEVKAADLRPGDYLCFPRQKGEEVPATPEQGRLLGFFLAEGSFLKRQGEPVEVQFCFGLHEKDTYAKEVCRLLELVFPESTKPWLQERPDRNTCVVHCTGRAVAEWFKKLGGEYSHKKRLDPEVLHWPEETLKALVGAWVDGDGGTGPGRSIFVPTASYDLACQMHLILSRMGLFTRMHVHSQGRPLQLRQVVNAEGFVERVADSGGRYPTFQLHLGETFAKQLAGYTSRAPATSTIEKRKFRVLDDMVMFPITSIEDEEYDGWVYDLEVEDDHSYVVEGVAVHNCTITHSTCTKCGNVAADETELCNCIKFAKGSTFYDANGVLRKVAELCGHESEPDGGVQFIEASWVGTPAFTGAVLRNVIEINPRLAKQAEVILSQPPADWSVSTYRKAAAMAFAPDMFLAGWDDDMGDGASEGEGGEEAPKAPEDPFKDLEEEVVKQVKERALKRLRDDLKKKDVEEALQNTPDESTHTNDNLVKQASYRSAIATAVRFSSNEASLLNQVAVIDADYGVQRPVTLYRTALKLGSVEGYSSLSQFFKACRTALGRQPSLLEAKELLRLSKLISMKGQE